MSDTDKSGIDIQMNNINDTRINSVAKRKTIFEKDNNVMQQFKTLVDSVIDTKKEVTVVDAVIQNKILRDRSPLAKLGRRKVLYRAVYGEFICSLIFYTTVFCTITNGYISDIPTHDICFRVAFVAGFMAIGLSFAFSSISGAQFNSAISFALWLTGKLSNRRCFYYICAQLSASIVAMLIVTCIFQGDAQDIYDYLTVTPGLDANHGKTFATEFFFTFFLTYIAFTVAFEDAESQKKENMSVKTISDSKGLTLYTSTPQSKTGFAPFSIGFVIFALCLMGGTGGAAFNPGRVFGPAIFSGNFSYMWLYWLGEIIGAATAALLVNNLHKFGLNGNTQLKTGEETSAEKVIKDAAISHPSLIASDEPLDDNDKVTLEAINDENRRSSAIINPMSNNRNSRLSTASNISNS